MNVLITGTSSGIGHALAQEYLNRGAKVWGISRRTVKDLSSDKYFHLSVDLCDYAQVAAQLPSFISGLKTCDLLVLNAGILGDIKCMDEMDLSTMKEVFEVNVWSQKFLLDHLFQEVEEVKQLIAISSGSALRSSPGWGAYAMSKAGLNMLMNIYAKEVPRTHFTALAPGLVDTEIQARISTMTDGDKYPAIKRLQAARHTAAMPSAQEAAPMLIKAIEKVLENESGGFSDVRTMDL